MHEFAVAEDLVEEVLCLVHTDGPAAVRAIHVSLGADSGFSADALRLAFEVITAVSPLRRASLTIAEVPGSQVVLQRVVLDVADRAPAEAGVAAAGP